MGDLDDRFLGAIETHDTVELRALLTSGLDARAPIRGAAPVTWLLEMYTRSDRFAPCLALLLEHGAELPEPALAPVLLDDAAAITSAVRAEPGLLVHRTTLRSAFTSLRGATLLHIAAEYGHVAAARALLDAGAQVDACAAIDAHGLDGHTPLFHTVNSNRNRSAPVMEVLLEAGARTDVLLPGLVWGRGFEWETTLFDVTPVSYAQAGCLPQMHRDERDIARNVRRLLAAGGRAAPPLENVPNRYLAPRPAATPPDAGA
jgi:ankyrin repeat protein